MPAAAKPTDNYKEDPEKDLNIVAYMFAGLAMMLNIRLSYSAAPFALLRFKLPENLFSVFVRTTSSALELWCIPSMLIGNIMEQVYNQTQDTPSYHTSALGAAAGLIKEKAQLLHDKAKSLETAAQVPSSTLTDLGTPAGQLKNAAKQDGGQDSLHAKATALSSDQTNATKAKAVIAAFNNVCSKYKDLAKQPKYQAVVDKIEKGQDISGDDEPKVQAVYDAYNKLQTVYSEAIYQYKLYFLTIPSIITNWLNFLTYVLLLIVYITSNIIDLFQKLIFGGPVIRAIMKEPGDIQTKANLINTTDTSKLKGAADALKQAAQTLQSNASVANARNFKDEYEAFAKAYNDAGSEDQNAVQTDWTDLKKIIDNANLTEENKEIKFYWIVIHSIFSMSSEWYLKLNTYSMKLGILKMVLVDGNNTKILMLTGTHTLTLRGGGDVQTVTVNVSEEQKGAINTIKNQGEAKINLKLNLKDVTLTLGSGNGDTLTATGSITTTKKVSRGTLEANVEKELTASHELTFTNPSDLKQTDLGSGASGVTIGPNGTINTLNLNDATDPSAGNSKPTELTLKLEAGTKSGGTVPNESLTLTDGNTLELSGGIAGQLTYDSTDGTLTATNINGVKYDLNDFNDTYKIQ